MKSNIPALLGLATLSTALPSGGFHPEQPHYPYPPAADFSLVGYGKENPLGETTGGDGGATTTVSSIEALRTAVEGDEPAVVYVEGSFTLDDSVSIGSNKSLLGTGAGANFTGAGLSISGAENVIVRNVKIGFVEGGDAIGIKDSRRVWIDHNEFESDMDGGPDFYVCSTLPEVKSFLLTWWYRMVNLISLMPRTGLLFRGITSMIIGRYAFA